MTEKAAISQNESPNSKDKHSEDKRSTVGEIAVIGHPPILHVSFQALAASAWVIQGGCVCNHGHTCIQLLGFVAKGRGRCQVLSHFSHVRLFATLWTVAHLASLSKGFSRQERWSGWTCPPQGIFPPQGSNPCLLCLLQCRWILYHQCRPGSPEHMQMSQFSKGSKMFGTQRKQWFKTMLHFYIYCIITLST